MKKSIGDKFEFHILIFSKKTCLSPLIINKITVIVSLLYTCNKMLKSSKDSYDNYLSYIF